MAKKTKAQIRAELAQQTAEFLQKAQVAVVPMGEQRVYTDLRERGFSGKEIVSRKRRFGDKLVNIKVNE
jgi:hypothetical protein